MSLALFLAGAFSLVHLWGPADRMPAAVPGFSSGDIGVDSSEEVLKSADINLEEEVYLVSFPNFSNVCNEYDNFSFTFTTPNVKVSGASPSLTVSGKCKNLNSDYALKIPFKRIMQERPADLDLSLPDYANLEFKVREVIGFWPEFWVLTEVKFVNSASSKTLLLDERAVAFSTNNKISMQWK